MKAAVFDAVIALKDVPMPEPKETEALVKVTMAGICKTDVEISRGYMNFQGILGHEFVGTVEASPDPNLVGKRVVGEINAGCGKCQWCRSGMARHCSDRTVLGIAGLDGALAEYVILPRDNLIPVPDVLPDEVAVFTEPVAAALEILEQVQIHPADSVLVIGDGKLGLLVCMALRLAGCELTLLGKHPEKLAIAAGLGCKTAEKNKTKGLNRHFDIVVEASGSPSGWDTAIQMVRPRGVIVLKSTYHGNLEFNPAPLVIDEITVVGSRCGRFEPALRLLAMGLIDPTPLISGTYPLDAVEEAFQAAMSRGCMKILVKP